MANLLKTIEFTSTVGRLVKRVREGGQEGQGVECFLLIPSCSSLNRSLSREDPRGLPETTGTYFLWLAAAAETASRVKVNIYCTRTDIFPSPFPELETSKCKRVWILICLRL